MHRKSIKFRDVWVAPGSECFAALEAGDRAKADRIYHDCETERIARERNIPVAVLRTSREYLLERPSP